MAKLMNLARMSTGTTGTGTITLGSAVDGCLSFVNAAAAAGVSSGDTITYGIEDGDNSEVGRGVWTSPSTLTRATILASTNGGSAISLSGSAEVFCVASAQDIAFSGASVKRTGDHTLADYSAGAAVAFDDEDFDDGGWHDNSSSNTRLTPPVGVTRAVFTFNVTIASITSDTSAIIEIRKNGVNTGDGTAAERFTIPATTYLASVTTGVVKVDTPGSDYWEAFLILSDNSVTITANRTNFSGYAVG